MALEGKRKEADIWKQKYIKAEELNTFFTSINEKYEDISKRFEASNRNNDRLNQWVKFQFI